MTHMNTDIDGIQNPLVHMRFNTRTDSDGNKVLFIEEIQSDWHQAGAKRVIHENTFQNILLVN